MVRHRRGPLAGGSASALLRCSHGATVGVVSTNWLAVLLAGVVGSVVASLASLGIALLVLHRTQAAGRTAAQEEREVARLDERRRIGEVAARDLLRLLAELESWWQSTSRMQLRRDVGGGRTLEEGHDALRRAVLADAPVLHDAEVARRVEVLEGLAGSRCLRAVVPEGMSPKDAWERGLQMFLAYERHCRASLEALLNERSLPAAMATPALAGDGLLEAPGWPAPVGE